MPRSVSSSGDASPSAGLSAAFDELYGAPFERFTDVRRELAVRMRAAGDVAGARVIAAASKPTRTAWALNQVARRRGQLMTAVVGAWKAAAAGPENTDAATIRDRARRYREAVASAVQEARRILAQDSIALSAMQARRMSETLQALVSDDNELLIGRLTRDVTVEDPFAGFEVGSESCPPGRRALPPEAEAARADVEAEAERTREIERVRIERQRAIDEARERVVALEVSCADAGRLAAAAQSALARAKEQVQRTQAAAEELEQRLLLERSRLDKLPR